MSQDSTDGLGIQEFASAADLELWLEAHHATSPGIWVRLYRSRSAQPSVVFEDLLELGLCFGWSESTRRAYDVESYLQRFTPRRTRGTTSERNRRLVVRPEAEGRMRSAGREALGG